MCTHLCYIFFSVVGYSSHCESYHLFIFYYAKFYTFIHIHFQQAKVIDARTDIDLLHSDSRIADKYILAHISQDFNCM